MKKKWPVIIAFAISVFGMIAIGVLWRSGKIKNFPFLNKNIPALIRNKITETSKYPVHKNIIATTFWVGESASSSNDFISNSKSAWDEDWKTHFGGTDDPENRNGFNPAGFTPRENPFYFALPYNDLNSKGVRKKEAATVVYWYNEKKWSESRSMLKNQWIKITKNGKSAYAQWEDVGPFGEDDKNYVFGNSSPKSKENNNAGLDVSPAVKDYLGLDGESKVDWQFVKESDVPNGPWKETITTS